MEPKEVVKSTGVCAATGRALAEGEEYYAVLFEEGDSFRRVDYTVESWTEPPPGAYCFFKARVPVRQEKQKQSLLIDDAMLVNFFCRLAEETEPVRLQFRFVLALILMRKRLLRYEQTVSDAGQEYWQMRLTREKSLHRVLNPQLTDEQIEGVSQQLGAILRGDLADRLDQEPPEGGIAESAGLTDGDDRPGHPIEAGDE
ncbi:MAG: hypothetical protein GY778_06265 [bacterium]|nr:hypothetical protein [bacterium]